MISFVFENGFHFHFIIPTFNFLQRIFLIFSGEKKNIEFLQGICDNYVLYCDPPPPSQEHCWFQHQNKNCQEIAYLSFHFSLKDVQKHSHVWRILRSTSDLIRVSVLTFVSTQDVPRHSPTHQTGLSINARILIRSV